MSRRLRQDIEFEQRQLRAHLAAFDPTLKAALRSQPGLNRTVVVGAALHSFYNGIEGILKRIAREVDGGVPRGEGWHRELLRSMSRPTRNRGPVFDENLAKRLEEYLAFRHVFRGHYGTELDWTHMQRLVEDLDRVGNEVHESLARFASSLPVDDER